MFLFPLQALRDLYVKDGGSEKDLENEYFKEIDIRLKCEDAVIVMSLLEAPGGNANKENPPQQISAECQINFAARYFQ